MYLASSSDCGEHFKQIKNNSLSPITFHLSMAKSRILSRRILAANSSTLQEILELQVAV